MTSLPIVERELRVAARRRWTYWGRCCATLLTLIAAAIVLLCDDSSSSAEIGSDMFYLLAIVVFCYVAIVGTQLTCDCLSTEKREGTLGLLFLTDLRGYDVVFGKLAATSLHAAYTIVAMLPVLAIPLLLGGVTNGEVWRVTLVSGNLLFFFLSAGIFASSVCVEDQRALALSILLGLVAVLNWPVLASWMALVHPGYHSDWLGLGCPAFGCFTAFDDVYRTKNGHQGFWYNALFTQAYSWIFLLLAGQIVRRSWQDQVTVVKRSRWRDHWRGLLQGTRAARADVRQKLLPINPFLWRARHQRDKYITLWAALGVAAAAWALGVVLSNNQFVFDEPLDVICVVMLHAGLKVWMASEASRCLAEDSRSGGLELLLTTPLSATDIVRGQRQALWRHFAAPLAVVLGVDCLFLAGDLTHVTDAEERQADLYFYLVTTVFFVTDLLAISWLAMRLGLTGRRPVRIIAASFWWTVLLPGLVSLGITIGCMMRDDDFLPSTFALVWGIPSLIADAIIFSSSKFNMLERLREGAAGRPGTLRDAPPVA